MADEISISTRVEGVDQALSDIQRLQSQIERLGQYGAQGAVPGSGGSVGAAAGGGGPVRAMGPQVVYQPPPAFTPATPGGPSGAMGPATSSPSPNAQPSDHSEADRLQRHFSSMVSNGWQQMGGMMASAGGMGGEFQMVSSISQLLAEMRQITQGVGQAAGAAAQAVGAIAQAASPGSAAGIASTSAGANLMSGLGAGAGGALAGAMSLAAITMATGHGYAMASRAGMIMQEPTLQFGTQYALAAALGFSPGADAMQYGRDIYGYDRQIAEIRSGQLNPFWQIGNFFLGDALRASADEREREIQFQRDARTVQQQRFVGERYLSSIGMGFGADGSDEFGRNLRIGRVAGVMGRYVGLGGLREGMTFDPSYATLGEMIDAESATVGAVLGNPNLGGGFSGGMGRNMEAAMRQAILSGDFEGATGLAKGIAARGGGGAAIDRASYDAAWFSSARGEASFAGARRGVRSAYVQAAEAGLYSRDSAAMALDAGGGDFDAEIRLLEAQLAYTDDRAQAEEIGAKLQGARVARVQAREAGTRYRFGLASERLGIASGRLGVEEMSASIFGGSFAGIGLQQAGIGMARSGLISAQAGSLTMSEEQRARMTIEAAQAAVQAIMTGAGGFQRDFGVAGAGYSLAGANTGLTVGGGYGALAAAGSFRSQVASAESQMHAAQGEIDFLRSHNAPEDAPAMLAARTRMAEAQSAMQRAGGGFASAPLPAAFTGQMEAAAFSIQVAGSLPGMYGSRREMMGQQMDLLAGAIGYRQRQRAEQIAIQGHLTPEEELTYQREIMGLQGQRVGLFNEMSYGWQNRLLSTVVNTPGNFAAIAPGLAMRAAVGAGVRNPLFGGQVGDIPNFMEQSMLVGSLSGAHSPAGLAATALQAGRGGGAVRLEGPVEVILTGDNRGIMRAYTGAPGTNTNRTNVMEMGRFAPAPGGSQ